MLESHPIREAIRLTRRDFLFKSGSAAAAVGYVVSEPILRQFEDWMDAGNRNEAFVNGNAEKLKNVSVGTTFCPERFGTSSYTYKRDSAMYKRAQIALDIATDVLGMRDIRMGLRWNSLEINPGEMNMDYYDPFIKLMKERGVNVCATIGAKAPGSPEQHYPSFLKEVPPPKTVIDSKSDFGRKSLEHIENTAIAFSREYGDDIFSTVQVENEPLQGFGFYRHVFDVDYLFQAADILHAHFPQARLLFNTSDISQLPRFQAIANVLMQEHNLRDKVTLGFDFYFQKPGGIFGGIPLLKHLDPIAGSELLTSSPELAQNIKYGRSKGVDVEVTEGQAEAWGEYKDPALKAKALRFMVKRSIDEILDTRKPSVLRTWGYEQEYLRFANNNQTSQNVERFDLIRRINELSKAV